MFDSLGTRNHEVRITLSVTTALGVRKMSKFLKPLILLSVLSVIGVPEVAAQTSDEWPPISYLRNDYRQVSVVAHVRVNQADVVNTIGGYEDWHLVGEVVESFKGKFRPGAKIEFYHGAEKGARRELFRGDKIIFLERNYVEKEKRWVLAVLENSTLPYSESTARKLRKIRSKPRKARRQGGYSSQSQ